MKINRPFLPLKVISTFSKKKFFLTLFMSLFISVSFSQTTLSTAVDFTVTDINGVEHNLFSHLDANKYVLIDFFYIACGPCQAAAPYFNETYQYFGCNSSNVICLALSTSDNTTAITQYLTSHDYLYPAAGIDHGSDDVCNTYGINAYPTFILIAPDRTIVSQDIWPLTDASTFINLLNANGGIAADCQTGISNTDNEPFTIAPNPVNHSFQITVDNNLIGSPLYIYDLTGKMLLSQALVDNTSLISIADLPAGIYFVNVKDITKKIIKY